jgi:hypothetical protein
MHQISAWIHKRPLVSFYVITFAITWGLGFSYIAVLKNELFLLLPLTFVATCGPALAGIIVTAVYGGQERPKLGRNRARWIVFFVAQVAGTAIFLTYNYIIEGVTITPVFALFTFFLLTPTLAFIISAAYSRGTAVRAMMASLVRLRGVAGWVLLALVFIGGITLSLIFTYRDDRLVLPEFWISNLVFVLFVLLIFFLSMRPTHLILAAEKKRTLTPVTSRINASCREMVQQLEAGTGAGQLPAEISALLAYEARLQATRTWTYNVSILRTLFFSVFIPLISVLARLALDLIFP